MKTFIYIVVSLCFSLLRTDSIQLNSNPQITLAYSFSKTDTIRFTIESHTQGYVGLGFGSQMAGTNIILSYMQNGNYVVKDTTASGHFAPSDNAAQNVLGVSGLRDSSKTTYIFERLLNTHNSNDYTIVLFQNTPLIWSYGGADTLVQHIQRGITSIVFKQCDSSCLTCSGPLSFNCDSCDTNHTLTNGSCVNNTINFTCNSSCATCTGTSNNCTSCISGKYLASNGSCLSCNHFCANCSGPSYLHCNSCPTGSFLNNDGGCVLSYTTCPDLNESSCFSIQLKSNPVVNLNYSFTNSSSITFVMEYYTQGFIGMGFGFNMSFADIILAYMTNGAITITDRTSWQHAVPMIDAVQYSQLIMGSRTANKTMAIFQRSLDLNATNKTVITPTKTQPMIFSYGSSDTLQYHGASNRGQVLVSFHACHKSCKNCTGPQIDQCSSCSANFTLINGYCASNQCSQMCQLCSNSECLQCDTTVSSLINGGCVCFSHYFQNSNQCLECHSSCLNCSGSNQNQCISCSDDFTLVNGSCQKLQTTCSDHCVTCTSSYTCMTCNNNISSSNCIKCEDNYTLQNGICAGICQNNCVSCNSSSYQCLSCNTGYTLINGTCVRIQEQDKIISIKLNDSPLIFLNYTFPSNDIIELIMEFHTPGYIAMGFGTQMNDADITVALMQNGQMTLKSMRASGHVTPTENSIQNLVLNSYSRDTEKTIVNFQRNLTYQRLLATGTANLYSISLNNNIPMIWSYGQTDILEQHINHGNQVVQFQQIICDSSCLTCSGAGSDQCLSCHSLFVLQNGSCLQNYCDSSCLNCSGTANNQCTSCAAGNSLVNGSCVNSSSNNSNNSDLLSDLTSTLKVTDQFYLLWKFNFDNTITMAFKWNTAGFMALGFGTSMFGMDVISAEIINGRLNVFDRWASDTVQPDLDSNIGGKNDLTLLASSNSNSEGFSIVKFKRALNTGDIHDYIIKQQKVTFAFAFGSSPTISYHGPNKFLFTFDFVEGANEQAMVEGVAQPDYIKAHGIGLLIVWSFLVDISLIIVRYFKNLKYYMEIHASMFFLLDIFTFIVVFIVIGKNGGTLEWKFQNDKIITAHFSLGVVVLSLIVFQHCFGLLMKKAIDSKKFTVLSSNIAKIKNAHRFLGYTIYLVTKASVLTGIWNYNDIDLFYGFCAYFGFLILFRMIIEIFYQNNFRKKVTDIKSPSKFRQNFEALIKDLELRAIPIWKIAKKYPKLKWCMLNNSLFDLNKFDHPGGQFIIEQVNGREVGRFFFGAYALEHTNLKPYTHSLHAKQLLDQRHVGEIIIEEFNVLQMIPTQKQQNLWYIVETTKITQSISKFDFASNAYLIKNHIYGVEWFGRHFTLHFPNSSNKKVRFYSVIISLTAPNALLRNEIIAFFEQQIGKTFTCQISEIIQLNLRKDSLKPLTVQIPPPTSQNLPLVIKRYDFPDSFSSLVHHHSSLDGFSIEGPFGPGLELTKNSNGQHIIFCGGTGIFPFVDLLNYLLQKSIYHVLLTTFGKEIAEQSNVYMEDYEGTFGSKFKVILYAAFQSKKEIEYFDFILTLYNINKNFNLNFFDMILKFSDDSKIPGIPITQSYFDDKFFSENIVQDQCSKIFVCGNPKMNKLIPEICLRNELEAEKIYIV